MEKEVISRRLRLERGHSADSNEICFFGTIDESSRILEELEGKGDLIINLKDVRKINSGGIKRWIEAMEVITLKQNVDFIECSIPIVDQVNMISNFCQGGRIRSFFAPYVCENCDHEQEVLLSLNQFDEDTHKPPEAWCERCHQQLVFDDFEEEYFQFVKSHLQE